MSKYPEIDAVLAGESDGCIVCGDCLDVMATMPDGCVDAVVTDPPYGIGINTKNAGRRRGNRPYDTKARARDFPLVNGDDSPFDPLPLLRFRNIVLWGANHYASRLPDSHCWFVWDRKAGKAADSDITDCELAWTKGLHYRTTRMFRHMWAGFQRESESGQKHLHPTQKPVLLMEWCLSFFPKATIILDPFCGSGTTCVAAKQLGRRYIGIEIDPEYCKIANNRLASTQRPLSATKAPKSLERKLFQ